MISYIIVGSIIVLALGYRFYGSFLVKEMKLDDSHPTPACQMNDGVDFVPARPFLLLGQHFSAIAAAGPIVGPIMAGIWFGWLPTLVWVILGSIFVGGVHDFLSLIVSIRHKAASIGEIVKEYMSPASYILFLSFIWLSLLYVIIVFTDITAQTFKVVSQENSFGPGVAASSFLYILIGLVMGVCLKKFKMNLTLATAVFLPLVLLIVWVGPNLPSSILAVLEDISVKKWHIIILLYCFVASVIPVWILLQPRGYLGGWLLYLTMAVGLIGGLFGGFSIQYPALNIVGLASAVNGKLLFPILFITVACGACSGFHSIVSSGTTSKQLEKESDGRVIGYGAMLIEALVAVLALATVMMLPKGDPGLNSDPNVIYANGLAKYMGMIGIGINIALPFALLAFSTFVYDTLDVTTRLARYILEELFSGLGMKIGSYIATAVSLIIPLIFLSLTEEKGYIVAWPIFGISNQLLASLVLMVLSVWLIKTGKNSLYAILPMIFMLVMTVWSLVLQMMPFLKIMIFNPYAAGIKTDLYVSGVCAVVLFIISVLLIIESTRVLFLAKSKL